MLDSPAANMMKECLQFLIEPAKKLKIRLKVLYSPLYSDRTTFARSNRLTSLPFYSVFFPPGVSQTGETREEGAASGESVIHHGAGEGTQ